MKRILLFLWSMFLVASFGFAQGTVTGTVTNNEGETLPGVNVVLKGTSTGTVTNFNGEYSINIEDPSATLVFSFIGYTTEEVEVSGRSVIDVSLIDDTKQLNEVVVVAYGESSRRSLTSAIGEIDTETIKKQQVVSVGRTLQGTVPGVNIITGSGQPGQNPTIRIRGISSINSSSDPLIVLDGAVYTGNLNTIDPNEIESISVLKDAAASALYGARAASGVIIINSKRGFAGKTNINVRASAGISQRAVPEYPFINAEQQMLLEWETLYNEGVSGGEVDPGQYATNDLLNRVGYNPYGGTDSPINPQGELIDGKELQWETDWEDALLQQGNRQDVALNISGGSDFVTYFISGSYLKQDGVVINSDFERFAGRINLNADLTPWLKGGLRQSISSSSQNFPQQSGSFFSNAVQYIRTMSSIYPIYRRDVNGDFIRDAGGNLIFDDGQTTGSGLPINVSRPVLQPSNAVAQTTLDRDVSDRFFSTSNIFLEASFLDFFTARSSFTLNKYLFDNWYYTNPEIGSARSVQGRVGRARDVTSEWTLTNSLNFRKTFNSDHNLDVLLLQEAYNYNINTMSVSKTGLPFGGLFQLNSAASLESIDGALNQERIGSLMARAEYNFKDKYFFQTSVRRDISSRFAPDSREGIFYSFSGSWLVSDEAFMENVNVFEFLKLRASYGELGNSFIVNDGSQVYFPAENVFDTGFDQLSTPGVYIGPLRNTSLTWETSIITNLGVDFGLFQNRLSGSVDAYLKETNGLIFARPLANSTGVRGNEILENVGSLVNRGIEVALNWDVISTEDFDWDLGANIAFERNRITELPQEEIVTGQYKYSEGVSVYEFWIEEWAGVSSQTGQPMWYENVLNENGEVVGRDTTLIYGNATGDDQIYAGTALPWGRGGLNTSFSYKGFDLSALMNFSLGGQILDFDYRGLMEGGLRPGNQMHSDILDRWQEPGDETDVPRLSTTDRGSSTSTRFLVDATYARIRNITLGYTLPQSITNAAGFINGLRVYIAADNLFTFFPIDGLDPEQSITGQTNNQSSVFSTVSAGIEIDL
ncbi:MAG: SusC/RagA family TonB-linked outer membrane protein [Cyclobacteriaceae bacterium]